MTLTLPAFIDLCQQYGKLGHSVQQQLRSVMNYEPLDGFDDSALRAILQFFNEAIGEGMLDAKEDAERVRRHLGEKARRRRTSGK